MKAVGICGSDVHYLKVWLNFSSIAYAIHAIDYCDLCSVYYLLIG
jgi:hypothetical protein